MNDPRNVVLVTVDSLRADHCGFLGSEHDLTPNLDAMASDGLAFERAVAPGPSTYDSMPAVFTGELMTGAEPSAADSQGSPSRTENIRYNMNRMTIPEWFQQQGYATAAFTANPYTGRHTGFARGFDHYQDFLSDVNSWLPPRVRNAPIVAEFDNLVAMMRRNRASKPWQSYYEDLVRVIDSLSQPFFVWVFLMEPHTPYLVDGDRISTRERAGMYYHNWKLWVAKKWGVAPETVKLSREQLLRFYRLAIQSMDEFFGRLVSDISHVDPAYVVHADHGEAFGEHGIFGHRETLYEENIHVPLLVHNASRTGRVSTPVSLTALPDLAIGAARGSMPVPEQGYAFSQVLQPPSIAVRGPNWKYIRRSDGPDATEEVYDLAADPEEASNQLDDQLELADLCRRMVRRRSAQDTEVRSVREAAAELGAGPGGADGRE